MNLGSILISGNLKVEDGNGRNNNILTFNICDLSSIFGAL